MLVGLVIVSVLYMKFSHKPLNEAVAEYENIGIESVRVIASEDPSDNLENGYPVYRIALKEKLVCGENGEIVGEFDMFMIGGGAGRIASALTHPESDYFFFDLKLRKSSSKKSRCLGNSHFGLRLKK